MLTRIRTMLRSRTTAAVGLALALLTLLPAEVLAYPPNPC